MRVPSCDSTDAARAAAASWWPVGSAWARSRSSLAALPGIACGSCVSMNIAGRHLNLGSVGAATVEDRALPFLAAQMRKEGGEVGLIGLERRPVLLVVGQRHRR